MGAEIGITQFSQIIYINIEIPQNIILINSNSFSALYMVDVVSINKDNSW